MLEPVFVISSNIDAIGYEDGTLFIRFKSGIAYAYKGVPYDHFDAMQKVESAGQYFHRFIKNAYRYERLDHDPFKHMPQPLAA